MFRVGSVKFAIRLLMSARVLASLQEAAAGDVLT